LTYSPHRRWSPPLQHQRSKVRSPSPQREVSQCGCVTVKRSLSPLGRSFVPWSRSPPSRSKRPKPALAERLADPVVAGRMAARAVWDERSRALPTEPQADRESPSLRTTRDVSARSLLD
jgi:hypothetical protein